MADSAKRDPRTYAIIGAAIEVHRILGPGFLETVYQEALAIEFSERDIPHVREERLPVFFKGRELDTKYRADFICYGGVLVELKAQKELSGSDEAQVIHYLKATKFELGMLLNFGTASLKHRRVILSQSAQSADCF